MDPSSAFTLNCMGKVYMRKSKASNSKEAIKDVERAEACFLRALQLFRFSMVKSGNEKVVDTLCNLNEARERQARKEGILRNVRFKASTVGHTSEAGHNINYVPSSDSADESFWSEDEIDSFADLCDDKKNCVDLGFLDLFSCGAIYECRDDK